MGDILRAMRSGGGRIGDCYVFVHVLPGPLAVVEVTEVEAMIGLPPSGMGAFLTTLPGSGGRVQFTRALGSCVLCLKGPPASHIVKTSMLACGACAALSEHVGMPVRENDGPTVTVWGLPAATIPDILTEYRLKHGNEPAGKKAAEILRVLVRYGLRATGHDPAAADALMAITEPRKR